MKAQAGITLLTAMALTATLASGCSKNEAGSSESASNAAESNAAATETNTSTAASGNAADATDGYALPIVKDGSVTLNYAGFDSWYPSASYTQNLPVWQEIEKRTGIKVNYQVVPSDQYDAKMQTQIAAGQALPDIMMLPPTWTNSGVYKLAQQNVILPLDDLIDKYAPDIKALLEQRPELKKLITAPDGKIYTVADLPLQDVVSPFFIRKDWLDKLNLKEPETLNDWVNVLTQFKNGDPNGNGKQDEIPLVLRGGALTEFGSAFGLQAGVSPFWTNDQGEVIYQYMLPAYKELLAFTHSLYDKGLLDKELTMDESNFNSLVSTNVVGASSTVIDYLTQWDSMLLKAGVAGADTIALAPPKGDDGRSGQYIKRSPMWSHYGISAASKNPVAAIKWINFVWASQEGNVIKDYGIEGKSYTMGADGPQYSDWTLHNPDNLDSMSALRSLGAAPSILVNDSLDVFNQKYAGTKVEKYNSLLSPAMVQPFPDVIPTDDESEVINSVMPDIQTYVDEMQMKFIMGKEPLDNFDKFVDTVRGMGIDKVLKIKQQQYDRAMK